MSIIDFSVPGRIEFPGSQYRDIDPDLCIECQRSLPEVELVGLQGGLCGPCAYPPQPVLSHDYAYDFVAVRPQVGEFGICDGCQVEPATVGYGNDYQGLLLVLCTTCRDAE